ncbi:lipase family protein [Nocardia jiangxiensis]|uniref:Lipase family protein n=1 Tax=Nocardia jiangxiensis TaxID=282685 RepID=A0ABW6S1W0_9NOCA
MYRSTIARARYHRLAAALMVGAFCVLAGGPSPAIADPARGNAITVGTDSFRRPPADLSSLSPGQIVGSRAVTPAMDGKWIPGVRGWQISFRSNDTHRQPILAITTLIVPVTAWAGPGARPVVSLQMAYDSADPQCAPSVSMATSSGNFMPYLNRNWAVAVPDHEGPRAAFMAGVSGGHVVLDGVRAVRAFTASGIGAGNPWVLDGESGGAQPTAWAAQLQPTYAPELRFAGAAVGGLPADPAVVARNLDGNPFSGLMFAALAGIAGEHPEAGIEAMLNAQGKQMLRAVRTSCDPVTRYPLRKLSEYSNVSDPISQPDPAAALATHILGKLPPTMPIFDYHGMLDEVVPVAQDDATVHAWCTRGARVHIRRTSFTEHITDYLLNHDAAVQYLIDRIDNKPVPNDC